MKEAHHMSTEELERCIKQAFQEKSLIVSWKNLYFEMVTPNSKEGTYIYYSENCYIISSNEKGRISEVVKTKDFEDILWHVIDIVSFPIAMDYAKKNYSPNLDFRREYFKKQVAVFSMFGDKFKQRKIDEIRRTVNQYPFLDFEC